MSTISPIVSVIAALLLGGGWMAAADPTTVTWDPLAQPVREADTLFLPDLSSWQKIDAEGGFLSCNGDQTSGQVTGNFDFGPGRFGPGVRPKLGGGNFVYYPVDGLIEPDEFTIEFHARSDKPWSAMETGRSLFAIETERGNRLQIMPYKGEFQVFANALDQLPEVRCSKHWKKSCEEMKLTADAWHAVALTLKEGTLRIYVNGAEAGKVDGLRFLPVWSDDTRQSGIHLGGSHGAGSGFWFSDLRISRTARIPGQAVKLRSLNGSLTIDADKAIGVVPPLLLGALHPGGPALDVGPIRDAIQCIRTDKLLTSTPMKRGDPDADHPAKGKSGTFSYDWQVVDRSLQWMKDRGVVPYFSIDSTPQILGGSVPPYAGDALTTWQSSGSGFGQEAPENFADWALVVGDFAHHVLKEKQVSVARWTVWNEPDEGGGFWTAGLERYLDLYAVTVRAVREVDPTARVGGPENAWLSSKWTKALFERCAKDKLPLDFIAYHDYSGDLNQLDHARAMVDIQARASGFPQCRELNKAPFPSSLSMHLRRHGRVA